LEKPFLTITRVVAGITHDVIISVA